MKISIAKPPKTLKDEYGNSYVLKELMPTGRSVNIHGKFMGFVFWFGQRLVAISFR